MSSTNVRRLIRPATVVGRRSVYNWDTAPAWQKYVHEKRLALHASVMNVHNVVYLVLSIKHDVCQTMY